jgi:hypothetical protein
MKSALSTAVIDCPPDEGLVAPSPPTLDSFFSRPLAPKVLWNSTTYGALVALVPLWAVKVHTTWGAWGNLTIDSGHEMYVPWLLAEGKTLYRDVWFLYGPAAPYFNGYLFRLFGVQLNVLYYGNNFNNGKGSFQEPP